MFALMRFMSVLSSTMALAIWRLRFALFEESRWRREACWRRTLPVAVILNRFETAFRVLLRAIGLGIRARKIMRFRRETTAFLSPRVP